MLYLDIRTQTELEIQEKNGFPFFYIGRGRYYSNQYLIWVSQKLAKPGDKLVLPLLGARLFQTEKGNLVLRPQQAWVTYYLYVPAGYRGHTELNVARAPEDIFILQFVSYRSELGALGISAGALISAPIEEKIVVSFERTGRTYGEEYEGVIVFQGGGAKVFEGLTYEAFEELQNEEPEVDYDF